VASSRITAAVASLFLLVLACACTAYGAHSASYHGTSGCKSAHKSSFHGSHCRKGGKPRRGRPAHLLFFTAKDGHCPYATLAPTRYDVAKTRAATLCLVNRERAAHGERALHWNIHLVVAAQAHTESMAFGDYFAHVGPHGQTALMRIRRTGYISSSRLGFEVGENIGWGSLWLGTPRAIVAAWMASAGHRANLLDGRFRDTGIGVSPHVNGLAHGQPGGIYTQDFGVLVG
jgi:uncharacterized protein YkwD